MDSTSGILICDLFKTLSRFGLPENTTRMMGHGSHHVVEVWFKLKKPWRGQSLWAPYTINNIQALYGKSDF